MEVIALGIVSWLLAVLLTPIVRRGSLALGWVDQPDQLRKLHRSVVPRTGGIAIMCAYVAAYGALLMPYPGSGVLRGHLPAILNLAPPIAVVFLTGLLDDVLDLKPSCKLLGQILAAAWMYAAGVRIATPGKALFSFVLTVAWLVLCANAFNLIDGVDGLAAGIGLTATLTTFAASVLHGDSWLGLATAPLAGCLLGFLRYNFSPASIFLGDSGSLTIGFLLGTYAVIWSAKSATFVGVGAPAVALALPLLEVGLSVIRRFLRRDPICAGDRGHIHHQLLDRGFTPHRVVVLLCGAAGFGAALSLAQSVLREWLGCVVILIAMAFVWAGVRYLGYAEFRAAHRFFLEGWRVRLRAHVTLEVLRRSLASAATVNECWEAITHAGKELGYPHINARLAGLSFDTSERGDSPEDWQMRMNLDAGDFVNVRQYRRSPGRPMVLAGFVSAIREALPSRIERIVGLECCCAESGDPLTRSLLFSSEVTRDDTAEDLRAESQPLRRSTFY